MDSPDFLHLVKNYTSLSEPDRLAVADLAARHPYSQLVHLLHARVAQDLQLPNSSELLHTCAVYSTDRTVLKSVMTSPIVKRAGRQVAEVAPSPAAPEDVVPAPGVITPPRSTIANDKLDAEVIEPTDVVAQASVSSRDDAVELTGDALRDDLLHELDKLQQLKHEFEASFEEFQKSSNSDPDGKRKSKPAKEADPLLAEIKSTKKKLKVESPKQKEQNEIIDQFIKTKPVIPKVKPAEAAEDLSEESSIFSDNIVSETLVGLLLKQGKKEKAIEVLKKLIWKFPQKKAYFAAQIDELKN